MMLLHSETSDANLVRQQVDLSGDQLLFDTAVVFDHFDLDVALRKRQQNWDDLQGKYTRQTNILLTLVANGGDSMSLCLEYGHKRYEGLNNFRGLCACAPL